MGGSNVAIPLHNPTPLLESRPLSLASQRSIWLKMEAFQPPGSFKIRGIGLACQEYARNGASRFISSSGGNAGIAVAYAGRQLGIPVTVVVPETTSDQAKTILRLEAAEVIVHGASWSEANALANAMIGAGDAFIHPFDDPLLWRGHASLIDEIAQTGVMPDAVVVSVGGGGLLCGVAEGLRRNGWHDVSLIAVETEGADSFSQSLALKSRIELAAITSVATSLGAKQVAEQALAVAKQHSVQSVVVSDRAAVSACIRFLDDHRVLTEPACGASLSIVYDACPVLTTFKTVVVVVCGGATAKREQLDAWAQRFA